MKVEPDSDNESFRVHPSGDVATDMKHEDHLQAPVFCAVKSEPQVTFLLCIEH